MSDTDGEAFWELMQLQGHNQMITKQDLLERLRHRGVSVGERQLTTYITERLVPKSARIGSRTGVFPELVVDLVTFISAARATQVSLSAIREVLPLWRYLKRSVLHEPLEIDLADLEGVIRQHVMSREAACAVPWIVPAVIAAGAKHSSDSSLVVKYNGRQVAENDPPVISFVVVEQDEDDQSRAYKTAQLEVVLPLTKTSGVDRTTMVVGAPMGVEVIDRRSSS